MGVIKMEHFNIEIEKYPDAMYRLYADPEDKQLVPYMAKDLAHIMMLDTSEWYAVPTSTIFEAEIEYLKKLGLSNEFIKDIITLNAIEGKIYEFKDYFKVIRLTRSRKVGDFLRCILVSKKMCNMTICEAVNEDFKVQEAIEDILVPTEMEE